jgi:lysophospholipase L1-like esterase
VTTLAANTSASVTLAAGYALYASGAYGTMQVVTPPYQSALMPVQPAGASVGPFPIAVTVNLTGGVGGISYQVDQDSNPVNVQFATDSSGNVTGLMNASGGTLNANIRKSVGRHALTVAGDVASGAAVNTTFQTLLSCPVPFYAVQVIYVNATSTDLSATLNCSVAPTAISSDRRGTGLTYTPLTFNSGALTQPPLVAAPNPATFDYTYVISDIMPVQSVAPTEGTEYKVLVRTWKSTAGHPYYDFSLAGGASAGFRAINGSELYNDVLGTGDLTTSAAGSVSNPDSGFMTCVGVIFHTVGQCSTIMAVGDSLSAGYGSASLFSGYPEYLKRLLATNYGKAAGVIACGKGSSASTANFKRARTIINAGARPRVCIFPIQTPNDPGISAPTTAQIHQRLAAAIQFTEFCADNDIIPIIMGPFPQNSLGAQGIAERTFFESIGPTLARNFGGEYISVLSLMSAGSAGSYAWASAGDYFDAIHPNDVGYAKIAALVASVVSKYV